jgi:hypothetical protein
MSQSSIITTTTTTTHRPSAAAIVAIVIFILLVVIGVVLAVRRARAHKQQSAIPGPPDGPGSLPLNLGPGVSEEYGRFRQAETLEERVENM